MLHTFTKTHVNLEIMAVVSFFFHYIGHLYIRKFTRKCSFTFLIFSLISCRSLRFFETIPEVNLYFLEQTTVQLLNFCTIVSYQFTTSREKFSNLSLYVRSKVNLTEKRILKYFQRITRNCKGKWRNVPKLT